MESAHLNGTPQAVVPRVLLYHFCRLQMPSLQLSLTAFERHLERCFSLLQAKQLGSPLAWNGFLDNLHAVDWFLCCACLERDPRAWEALFAVRVNRADCLLLDALRTRAVRFFPRDDEKQDSAVSEFWGYLLAGETVGSTPILARYDGQRPLAPWLIRVFQNWQISKLRSPRAEQALPDDDLGDGELTMSHQTDGQWHEAFREVAGEWLDTLGGNELLILGLRLRYRMSQREASKILGVNEGTVSRWTTKIHDGFVEYIGEKLRRLGWMGEDDELNQYVMTEMHSLILDAPRLSADRLAALLAERGKTFSEKQARG
jgi:RNA polymerase sigma factor (sigma-70 family)